MIMNILISKIENQFYFKTHSQESIETLSALEIAEQLTYIDHQIFISISSE